MSESFLVPYAFLASLLRHRSGRQAGDACSRPKAGEEKDKGAEIKDIRGHTGCSFPNRFCCPTVPNESKPMPTKDYLFLAVMGPNRLSWHLKKAMAKDDSTMDV